MTLIKLDIDLIQFQYELRTRVLTSAMCSLPELIINIISEQLKKQLNNHVTSGEILRFNVINNHSAGSPDIHLPPNRWPPQPSKIQLPWFLKDLPKNKIIDLGWFEFTIVTKRDNSNVIHFEDPVNLIYSVPVYEKIQALKTINKHIIRIGWNGDLGIPTNSLLPVADPLVPSCKCSPDYLTACIDSVWDWTIRFICKVCGKSYFCECFKTALEQHYKEAVEKQGNYSEQSWPNRFIAKYKKSQYRKEICHLCRDIPSEISYCNSMYGSNTKVHYGPYIKRTAIENNIDEREAENKVRDLLGIPRINEGWISEVELLNIVKEVLSNKEIIHQASPEWLGKQRFDIFIPELKIAIEYQGQQHYKSIPLFGGEEGFLKTLERDKLKAKLCAENGVRLIYFRYDENINRSLVETRIKKLLTENTTF